MAHHTGCQSGKESSEAGMNTHHQLWLDSLNYHQSQGKTLAEALTLTEQWPFPSINGQQTYRSRALMLDKSLHKYTQASVSDVEEALL